jgi:hypothetical protein
MESYIKLAPELCRREGLRPWERFCRRRLRRRGEGRPCREARRPPSSASRRGCVSFRQDFPSHLEPAAVEPVVHNLW